MEPSPRKFAPPAPAAALSSSELLRRCLLERRDADWRRFFELHGDMLRRIVGGMLLRRLPRFERDELDDALQEVYCRLLRWDGVFAGSSDRELWGFLCRTAASVVIDGWRRRQRRGGWLLVPGGLLRSTDALVALRDGVPRGQRRGGVPLAGLPAGWLDRGPEDLLLAREAALERYFALPRRRRRLVWRQILGPPL